CRGRVDAPLLFGLGNALDAVSAALVAELLVDLIAGDAEDDFLEAALLAGTEGDVLDFPAHITGKMGIHTVKIASEQRGLVAARAGANFHDQAIEALAGVDKQEVLQPTLKRIAASLQDSPLLLGESAHVGIGLVGMEGLDMFEGLAD